MGSRKQNYNQKYVGEVVDNNDPLKKGRIKVIVPYIFDGIKTEDLPWCEPNFPYGGSENLGFFFVPEKGSNVIIEFIGGSKYKPIWTGTCYREYEGENIPPEEAIRNNYTHRKIIKTKTGYILFDDKDKEITVYHDSGHYILMNEKVIEIANACGSHILIPEDGNIYLEPKKTVHVKLGKPKVKPKVLLESKYKPPKRNSK
jgi:uncharacterized protein involved in type VI secretion and phage assembly